jgi:hypothetical protein
MAEQTTQSPIRFLSRQETVEISDAVLSGPKLDISETEDVFTVDSLGLDWDFGVGIFQPKDESRIAVGPDGRRIGIFMLHGGSGDYKLMAQVARVYAERFGHKVVAMSLPGRLCLDADDRNWPGDTIRDDGTVRTPIWQRGEHISADQYDVVTDDTKRLRYGTRTVARAKPGTRFWDRMAGWPAAYEVGAREAMRKHLGADQYSIYGTGHSTGGPHIFMMCQRVPNMAGVLAVEHSPFGVIQERQHDWSGSLGVVSGYKRVSTTPAPRADPFNELYIRTWRDLARYAGPEALGQEGPAALMRLPWLMEDILDRWTTARKRPQFKAEYIITHNIQSSLRAAARATAERLGLSPDETQALEDRYGGYPQPLTGPDALPVPPILFTIAKDSRDHNIDVYREVVLPAFAQLDPAPKTALTQLGAGVHSYWKPEPDLPAGVTPVAAKLNHDAIMGGYFMTGSGGAA